MTSLLGVVRAVKDFEVLLVTPSTRKKFLGTKKALNTLMVETAKNCLLFFLVIRTKGEVYYSLAFSSELIMLTSGFVSKPFLALSKHLYVCVRVCTRACMRVCECV